MFFLLVVIDLVAFRSELSYGLHRQASNFIIVAVYD